MSDLYGDEALYDGLLRQAMLAQICERCGYEMGHEVAGVEDHGTLVFVPLRFKRKCEQCREELRQVRDARRDERERKAKEKVRRERREAKKAITKLPIVSVQPERAPGLTWDALEAMVYGVLK
jgi:hypothetical protein